MLHKIHAIFSLLFYFAVNSAFCQNSEIHKIAFGSCAYQKKPQPILEKIVQSGAEIFIYAGDNIYGDTRSMDTLRMKYNMLAAKPEFQNLKKNVKVFATWDDHDYGENDAGKYYSFKNESKEIFLNFWEEPENSERRKHEGIYHSKMFGTDENSIQMILLDTRTFRDNLLRRNKADSLHKNDYVPYSSGDSTILGNEQWKWLEEEFKKEAKIRIVVSSNQFAHEYNGWESWTNVPHEQKKMLELIKSAKANGIIFISGDVHWGEISVENYPGLYPIYDVTSSGITQTWDIIEPNKNRIGEPVKENNFGLITVYWKKNPQEISLQIIDNNNTIRVEKKILLNELDIK